MGKYISDTDFPVLRIVFIREAVGGTMAEMETKMSRKRRG
jgi:hypothetical protein